MRFSPRILSSAAALAITCVVSAAAYYYKSRSEINEVMVFCKLHLNAFNTFDMLMSYVDAAKRSVNVCMPGIHNPAIQGRLVKLIRTKNIKIRILIDRDGYDSSDFLLKELIDAGAEVKSYTKKATFYNIHHKFCLVDDKVLMTGTLNWGMDRSDFWNYVYVTSKSTLVEPVKQEFYHIWKDFSNDIGPGTHLEEPSSEEECEQNTEYPDEEAQSDSLKDCGSNCGSTESQAIEESTTPEIKIS